MKSALRMAAGASVGLVAAAAQAVPMLFTCTTNNSGQCAAVASQLSLNVLDLGGGQATFEFANAGPIGSSITDFYWRSTDLTGGGAIVDSGAGVSISWVAAPPNPGGGIAWNAAVSADSNPPAGPNGVGPSEWVRFTLGYTGSFEAMVAALNDGVAIHVQRIGRESEWMVARPIPEPETYALMLGGLSLLGFLARRRRG